MPAKKEYLTTPAQRILKITAGLIGGYALAVATLMVIGVLLPYRIEVIVTGAFSVFVLWIAFIIIAFLARNGWMIWGIYLLITLFFSTVIYFLR